ncbi:MAG: hypothetical protein KGZ96_03625 [Clostridia bacterium]|nr:hypothetical protein [Clostridia bacterium]
MTILSQKNLSNNPQRSVMNHLSQLHQLLDSTKQLPQEVYSKNLEIISSTSNEIVYNSASFYKGVRIISKGAANKLALIGLLKSLYMVISQIELTSHWDIKKSISQLEHIIHKMSHSLFPFFCSSQPVYHALDLLEKRLHNLDFLKVGHQPLTINITSLNNPVYFAHYLPNCNYINLYSIRKTDLAQELIFHEIGHLLIFANSGTTRILPEEYLRLFPKKNSLSALRVEEFCDDFSDYIINRELNHTIISFFDNYLQKSICHRKRDTDD